MDAHGWAAGVMTALRWVAHVLAVQALLVLGTLAGGVVLGLAPALDAGGRVLARLPAGDPSPHVWAEFWRAWRAGWRRANVVAAPLAAVGALLAVDAWVVTAADGPVRAALGLGLGIVGAWTLVVLAYLPAVLRRYCDPAPAAWRFLALAPALGPGTALAVLLAAVVWAATCWVAPPVAVLGGLAVPLLATGWLVDVRLDRLDARVSAAT
ncbi:YesL family protein [Cellulomonas iranensis]|uniref:YesL family protein n=1 Tax=Cellulomonas iranensis TaxID=76862 RepID=UPI003D7EABCC